MVSVLDNLDIWIGLVNTVYSDLLFFLFCCGTFLNRLNIWSLPFGSHPYWGICICLEVWEFYEEDEMEMTIVRLLRSKLVDVINIFILRNPIWQPSVGKYSESVKTFRKLVYVTVKKRSDRVVSTNLQVVGTFYLHHRGRPRFPSKQRAGQILSIVEGTSVCNQSKRLLWKFLNPKGSTPKKVPLCLGDIHVVSRSRRRRINIPCTACLSCLSL